MTQDKPIADFVRLTDGSLQNKRFVAKFVPIFTGGEPAYEAIGFDRESIGFVWPNDARSLFFEHFGAGALWAKVKAMHDATVGIVATAEISIDNSNDNDADEHTTTPPVVNGHVLITAETCGCDKHNTQCPTCDRGDSVCSLCGSCEEGLVFPCRPTHPATVAFQGCRYEVTKGHTFSSMPDVVSGSFDRMLTTSGKVG